MCKWSNERVSMNGRLLQRLNVMFPNKGRDYFVKSGTCAVPRAGQCPLLVLLSVTTNIPTHSLIYSESFPVLLTTLLVVVSSDKAGGIFWFNVPTCSSARAHLISSVILLCNFILLFLNYQCSNLLFFSKQLSLTKN